MPTPEGTSILRATNKNVVYVKGHTSSIRLSQIYSWLYQIGKFIEIYTTPNYEATCMALISFYKGDQKEDHDTLNRYFKKMTFNPNPQVIQLMGLLPGVGEKRAEALISKFTTTWNVVSASPEQLATVDGIGKVLSRQLLQRIGRTDV